MSNETRPTNKELLTLVNLSLASCLCDGGGTDCRSCVADRKLRALGYLTDAGSLRYLKSQLAYLASGNSAPDVIPGQWLFATTTPPNPEDETYRFPKPPGLAARMACARLGLSPTEVTAPETVPDAPSASETQTDSMPYNGLSPAQAEGLVMKIVFLDFDGVIITVHTSFSFGDPYCVQLLNSVLEKTGAKIVVSSSWRLGTSVQKLQAELTGWGVKGEVIDKTPWGAYDGIRGEEIQEWLDAHPDITEFVILDDDSDMGDLAHRHVKTHELHGMEEKDERAAIKMLKGTNDTGTDAPVNPEAPTTECRPVPEPRD